MGIRRSEIGIRLGEKLFEELLNESDRPSEVIFPEIYVGKAALNTKHELVYLLEKLPNLMASELKGTLVGVANRRNVEVRDSKLVDVG